MRKNIFCVLVMLLALCCLFIGCDNPAGNGKENNDEQKGPAVANWFEYTTSTSVGDGRYVSQTSIFYINIDGIIERAGSERYEYFGTQLEMIQSTLSWSICRENSNTDSLNVKFKITEPPVWADNKSDDNSNNDIETGDGNDNNTSDGDNNNDDENDIPSEDNKPELTLPSGYEWWCFEDAVKNYNYYYVLYYNNEAIRCGVETYEMEVNELYKDKTLAINNFMGNKYQITDLTKLPSWAL